MMRDFLYTVGLIVVIVLGAVFAIGMIASGI